MASLNAKFRPQTHVACYGFAAVLSREGISVWFSFLSTHFRIGKTSKTRSGNPEILKIGSFAGCSHSLKQPVFILPFSFILINVILFSLSGRANCLADDFRGPDVGIH